MDVWLLKQVATLDIALKPPFEPFTHRKFTPATVSRPKFRLESLVWLYAGGVSLILPDVRFGIVAQDWVTYCILVC